MRGNGATDGIRGLKKRHTQSDARAFPGGHEAGNTAADHDDIARAGAQIGARRAATQAAIAHARSPAEARACGSV
ncbi:hypothetical protein GCM10027056_05950 [Glaciibacter psychrotolerans]